MVAAPVEGFERRASLYVLGSVLEALLRLLCFIVVGDVVGVVAVLWYKAMFCWMFFVNGRVVFAGFPIMIHPSGVLTAIWRLSLLHVCCV